MSGRAGQQHELDPRRLEEIFRVMPAAVAVLRGPEHVFEFANARYERLIGRGGVVGRPVREAVPEIEGQGFLELLDRVYATGEPFVGDEVRALLDPSGSGELREIFLNFVYTATRAADGGTDGIFVHAVDVTELVRARREVEGLARELEDARARLETVLEQMPAGLVIAEVPSGRLVRANRLFRDLFGDDVGALEGVPTYDVLGAFHEDGRPYAAAEYPLSRAIAAGEVVVGEEIEFRRPDGPRRLSVHAAPVRDDAGAVVAAVFALFDVTERRRAEAMLETHERILRLVAEGAPLGTTLDGLARMIEGALLGRRDRVDPAARPGRRPPSPLRRAEPARRLQRRDRRPRDRRGGRLLRHRRPSRRARRRQRHRGRSALGRLPRARAPARPARLLVDADPLARTESRS